MTAPAPARSGGPRDPGPTHPSLGGAAPPGYGLEAISADLVQERRTGNPEQERRLPLVAAGVGQRQRDMASFGFFEGGRRHRRFGSEGPGEGGHIEARQRQVHNHPVRPRNAQRLRRLRPPFGGHHVVATRREGGGQPLASRRVHRQYQEGEAVHPRTSYPSHPAEQAGYLWPDGPTAPLPPTQRMTDLLDLPTVTPGQRIQDPLLVVEVEQRGGDSPHTVLTFSNASGRLPSAPFWLEDQPRIAGIAPGCVAQVIGEVGLYRGQRQLKVSSIRPLPQGTVDLRRLVPAIGDTAPYWKTLDGWRAEIPRPRLAATLALFYDDDAFRLAYEECPASLQGHHALLGGLLKHTVEVAGIARTIARACRAEADLVLAGVLLHDIGKLDAYRWERGVFESTEAGTLHGHVVLGALRLDRAVRAAEPPPCTERELAILQHLVLSHHGRLEYGAAVPPMTLEAEVLHYADNASAKTASMAEALADPANFDGDNPVSARPLWQLDRRRAYRGRSDWGG